MLTYRAIDHRSARARCQHPAMPRFPGEIIEMADLFVRLQAARHRADYAPQTQDSRSEVLQMATETELTIRAFEAADPAPAALIRRPPALQGKERLTVRGTLWHCPGDRAGNGAAVSLHQTAGHFVKLVVERRRAVIRASSLTITSPVPKGRKTASDAQCRHPAAPPRPCGGRPAP